MSVLAAPAAVVLVLLTALVQPTPAAADPTDLTTTRPAATESPEPSETGTPNQSALAPPSESATGDPTGPTVPPATTEPPVATGSDTPAPSSSASDAASASQPPTNSPSPSANGSSAPPVTPDSSAGPTTTPPVTPSGGTGTTTAPGGTTTTPVTPVEPTPTPTPTPEPETAPAVENAQWATALFAAPEGKAKDPATLAPSVNTVPVVTARAVCGGIVFANPDGAYSAVVAYGSFTEAPKKPVVLEPTTIRFVPISGGRVDWAAKSQDASSGASTEVVGAAGYGESVEIPRCPRSAGAVHVVAMAPCLARGQDAVIMVENGKTALSNELSWRISREGDPLVLAQGVLGRNGVSSVDLSSFGVGTYTVAVSQNGRAADQADFEALDCVATSTSATTCEQVTVTNPIRNPVAVTVTWRTDAAGTDRATGAKLVKLQPGSGVDLDAVAGAVQWSAISTGSTTNRDSLIGDAGSDRTVVADDCSPADPSAGPTTGTKVPATQPGTTTGASPEAGDGSNLADPTGAEAAEGGTPGSSDAGSDVASSAALLGGIAVGGAALVWLLATLLRRRP